MNTAVMFSSGKDDWETPADLFAALDYEFAFTVDVAANRTNSKCAAFYGPGSTLGIEDALATTWGTFRCWMNPPYSRKLQAKFIEHAAKQARLGALVVALVPARTDTRAFHKCIWDSKLHRPQPWVQEVRFLPGRLKFVGAKHGAPFPSMVVIFRGHHELPRARGVLPSPA
jgi:phage N-6-adenine-methyltransferase